MMAKLIIALLSLTAISQLSAQQKCSSSSYQQEELRRNPSLIKTINSLEVFAAQSVENAIASRTSEIIIKIPVVVHILYRTPTEKVTDAQVNSQIDALNKYFRRRNSDTANTPAYFRQFAADCEIEFQLASSDSRSRSTTGIIRKYTPVTKWKADDQMKFSTSMGDDAWDPKSYLNIWVCNLGDGLLGYAQFPGGPANTDGVVVLNTAFGNVGNVVAPFNLGRTTTHEVGHWLNLRHIWGDTEDCSGSDFIGDTPNQQFPNRGKPSFPHATCGNGPHGDMFMNYMDYVDDAAMFMFTKGQVERMQVAISLARAGFIAYGKELTS